MTEKMKTRLSEIPNDNVILLDASPLHPRCAIETVWGCSLVLAGDTSEDGSTNNDSLAIPRVSSLSILQLGSDGSFLESPLFLTQPTNNDETRRVNGATSSVEKLFKTTQSIRGLQRRLEGLVKREKDKFQKLVPQRLADHPLEIFRKVCSMIFEEFLSSMQYFEKLHSTTISCKKNFGSILRIGNTVNYSSTYTKSLFQELEDLEIQFPNQKVVEKVTEDLKSVSLFYQDGSKRCHSVTIDLDWECNQLKIVQCHAKLPAEVLQDISCDSDQEGINHDAEEPDTKRQKTLDFGKTDEMMEKTLTPIDLLFLSAIPPPDFPNDSNKIVGSASSKQSVINSCYQRFVRKVDILQMLWTEMECLDQYWGCIVDANHSFLSSTQRKIPITLYDYNLQLLIDVDPYQPRYPPRSYQFTSSSHIEANVVRLTKSRFEQNLQRKCWDTAEPLWKNLKLCLELSVLKPSAETDRDSSNKEDTITIGLDTSENNECGICYTAELVRENDLDSQQKPEVPSITCEQATCRRVYHTSCLQEWLESLASSRVTFDIIIGECPYCQEPVSAPLPGTYY